MKKTSLITFLMTLAISIVGGGLYSSILKFAVQDSTGLIERNSPLFIILILLTLLFIIISAFYSMSYKYNWYISFSDIVINRSPVFILSMVLCIVFLSLSALSDVSNFISEYQVISAVRAALSVLSISAVIKLISSNIKGVFDELFSFYQIIPTFWCCFNFMMIYKENAANPAVNSYIFKLIAGLCVMLAVFKYASFTFRRSGIRFCILFSFCGIFFTMVYYGGLFLRGISLGKVQYEAMYEFFGMIGMMFLIISNTLNIMSKNSNETIVECK